MRLTIQRPPVTAGNSRGAGWLNRPARLAEAVIRCALAQWDTSSRPAPPTPVSKRYRVLSWLVVLCGTLATEAQSADVTFLWNYAQSGAAGFALYCGLLPRLYTTRIDVGNTETFSFALPDGVSFCSVRAYDSAGGQSALSNELAVNVHSDTGAVEVIPQLNIQGQASVTVTGTGVRIAFNQPFDPRWLSLYTSELGAEGLPDVTLVGATTGSVRGSLVVSEDNHVMTFVKTGGVLAPDSYTFTVASRADGLVDVVNRPLDTDGDGVIGNDYILAFAVMPSDAPVLSIGEFARGPGQKVNLPAAEKAADLPVHMSNGASVREVAFTMHYNPALLYVKDVHLARLVAGELTLKTVDQNAGVVRVRVANLSGLTNASTILLTLQAEVPMDAPYGAQHVLDLRDLELNGGTLSGRDDDGLHVVAKLGDTDGDGRYSASDVLLIQRVIVRLDSGFSAYPTIDPVILGDLNVSEKLDAGDVLLLQRKIVRYPVPQIPD